MFPRLGRVNVEILELELVTQSNDQILWSEAATLRHQVRARMLAVCAEPDLGDRNALAELLEHLSTTSDKE